MSYPVIIATVKVWAMSSSQASNYQSSNADNFVPKEPSSTPGNKKSLSRRSDWEWKFEWLSVREWRAWSLSLAVLSFLAFAWLAFFAPEPPENITTPASIWQSSEENADLRLPRFNGVEAVKFVDADLGWVVGANGLFAQTTDGGKSWEKRKLVPDGPAPAPSAAPAPPTKSASLDDPNPGRLRMLEGFPELQPPTVKQPTFRTVSYQDANAAKVVQKAPMQNPPAAPEPLVVTSLAVPSLSAGWIGTSSGLLTFSPKDTAAPTWVQNLPVDRVTGIWFFDDQHGWVIGRRLDEIVADPIICFTTDGGATWSRESLPLLTAEILKNPKAGAASIVPDPILIQNLVVTGPTSAVATHSFGVIRIEAEIESGVSRANQPLEKVRIRFSSGMLVGSSGGKGDVPELLKGDFSELAIVDPASVGTSTNNTGARTLVAANREGSLFRSRDSGLTWSQVPKSPAQVEPRTSESAMPEVFGLSFVDSDKGFLFRVDGTRWQTVDGGDSWSRATSGRGDIRIEQVLDGGVLWGCDVSYSPKSWQHSAIFKSTDAGQTWQPMALPRQDFRSIVINSDRSGVIINSDTSSLKSVDLGESWQADFRSLLNPTRQWFDSAFQAQAWLSNATILAAKGNWFIELSKTASALRISKDSGRHWSDVPIQGGIVTGTQFVFPNSRRGFAIGNFRGLHTTNDGGSSWRRAEESWKSGRPKIIFDLIGSNSVGAIDAFHRSGDGEDLSAIAVGRMGTVWFTRDGARTCVAQRLAGERDLHGVAMLSPTRAVCVGNGGYIATTDNGGESWRPHKSGVSVPLRGVRFVTDKIGFACGDDATLLKSEDGGDNWKKVDVLAALKEDLNAIAFLSPLHGFLAGDNETLLVTHDGGANWQVARQYSKSAPLMCWVFFALALVGGVSPIAIPRKEHDQQESEVEKITSIASQYVTDAPVVRKSQDTLNFEPLVEGLSLYLRHEMTAPPLTLAITGEWGSGKSSLMNLLKDDLKRHGWRPVWFNAWHFQNEENLLAAILQSIASQTLPPWWTLTGMRYRLSIACGRMRNRPIVSSLLALLHGGLIYKFVWSPTETWTQVATLVGAIAQAAAEGNWAKLIAGSGVIGAVPLGTLISLYKAFSAFGVNPSELVRAGAASGKEVQRQTTFRERFSDNFKEVTDAIKPDAMVLFIDDLDRCDPDSVMTVLQAVNYLVSSGECYVVLGMAIHRVEEAVALARAKQLGSAKVEVKETPEQFAKNYLHKLVQLEVPVPSVTVSRAGDVCEQTEAEKAIVASPYRAARIAWRKKVGGTAIAIVVLSIAGARGIKHIPFVGSKSDTPKNRVQVDLPSWGVKFALESEATADKPANGATAANPTSPAPSGSLAEGLPAPGSSTDKNDASKPMQPQANLVPQPPPYADNAPTGPGYSEATVSSEQAELAYPNKTLGAVAAALFLLTAIAMTYLSRWRRTGRQIQDSNEFRKALATWLPLTLVADRRPRIIKRLVNRTRLNAMLSKTEQKDGTTLDPELVVAFTVLSTQDENLLTGSLKDSSGRAKVASAIQRHIGAKLDAVNKDAATSRNPDEVQQVEAALISLHGRAQEVVEKFASDDNLRRLRFLQQAVRIVSENDKANHTEGDKASSAKAT